MRSGRLPDQGKALPLAVEPRADDACGGWRPGARWARHDDNAVRWARRDEVEAAIETLPLNQRPPSRELGRRSEAVEHPFRVITIDDNRAPQPPPPPPPPRVPAPPPVRVAVPAEAVPLVTAHQFGNKVVIAAANADARALGLTPGMAVTHARALVPGLDVRNADPQADARVLHRFARFAALRWTPAACVEGDAMDGGGLLLDLSGVAHLHGGEEATARRIVAFCRRLGYNAQIGVAGTTGAAHALARHAAHPVALCPPHDEAQALSRLPVAGLRLTGDQLGTARRLGVETVGDLIAMPRAPVARRFGASLLTRLDQALGRVAEPMDAIVPYEMPLVRLRFAEPIGSTGAVTHAVGELVAQLVALLTIRGLGVRTLALISECVDGKDHCIDVGMARATRDPAHLLRLIGMSIDKVEPGFGIDAMRLEARETQPVEAQDLPGDLSGERAVPELSTLVDRLIVRVGAAALFRARSLESDVPERSTARVDPLAPATDLPVPWPRPTRLLRRPERLDQVIALMPDQPPRRFSWRGCAHIVRAADGPERITGEWWRSTAESYASRDYFRVEDEAGQRFWLFRRGDGEHAVTGDLSWWMHGVFG